MSLPITVGPNQPLYPGAADAIVPLAHDLWELFGRRLESQTYVAGDLLYAPAANQLGRLPAGAATQVLGLTAGVPAWQTASTYLAHALLSATHSDTTAGTVVRGDLITGQSATPTWQRLALGATAGQWLRHDGTDVGWSTPTLPNAATAGDVLYASGANVWAQLAIGAAGAFLRSTGTLPAWSTLILPNAATVGDLPYASATNTLAMLGIGGAGGILIVNGAGNAPAWLAAGANNRLLFMAAGAPAWTGTGLTWDGTTLTANAILCSGALEIDGALNHDGSTVGFFAATPVSQPAAYTQTYATADRTLGAYTADDESTPYTSAPTGADLMDAATVAKLDDLNALRTAYETLRALVEDAVQMLNSVVDDHQSLGLCAT